MNMILILFILSIACIILVEFLPMIRGIGNILKLKKVLDSFSTPQEPIVEVREVPMRSNLVGEGNTIKIPYMDCEGTRYCAYIQYDDKLTQRRKGKDLYGILRGGGSEKLEIEENIVMCVTPKDIGYDIIEIVEEGKVVGSINQDELIDEAPTGTSSNNGETYLEW